jgi:hypothetical protein
MLLLIYNATNSLICLHPSSTSEEAEDVLQQLAREAVAHGCTSE